jgi:hypothetical protein
MYKEKSRSKLRWLWGLAILAAVLLLWLILGPLSKQLSKDVTEQSGQAVRDAVLRGAVQCYAVEGAYPSSLSYLEDHYGLVINHEKYIVSYNAYASNLAPDVRVLVRGDESR